MKLPRRLSRRADIDAAAAAYLRWHGPAGARRVVGELRSFWSRRGEPGRAAAQVRILRAIDTLTRSSTLH